MQRILATGWLILILIGVLANPAWAQEPAAAILTNPFRNQLPGLGVLDEAKAEKENNHGHEEPGDLTLGSFFSAGWNENFKERSHEGRAPRLHLFKTRQGFLERELRFNYSFAKNADRGAINEHEFEGEIEYALNRRFLIEFEPNYTWEKSNLGGGTAHQLGATWVVSRLALVDTYWSAYALDFRVIPPTSNGQDSAATFGFFLAGFEDLTRFGLYRTGLYYSGELFTRAGPLESGGTRNETHFGVSLAKTLTDPHTPLLGDFTLFVEGFARTLLDGERGGQSEVTLTPGLRFKFFEQEKTEQTFWFMTGVEIPIAGRRQFDYELRFAFIWEFE